MYIIDYILPNELHFVSKSSACILKNTSIWFFRFNSDIKYKDYLLFNFFKTSIYELPKFRNLYNIHKRRLYFVARKSFFYSTHDYLCYLKNTGFIDNISAEKDIIRSFISKYTRTLFIRSPCYFVNTPFPLGYLRVTLDNNILYIADMDTVFFTRIYDSSKTANNVINKLITLTDLNYKELIDVLDNEILSEL